MDMFLCESWIGGTIELSNRGLGSRHERRKVVRLMSAWPSHHYHYWLSDIRVEKEKLRR